MSDATTNEPAPVQGDKEVYRYVMVDVMNRAEMGKRKYGTTLQSHNGRDALWDAYQEALDLVMYLRQFILETEDKA